MLSCRARLTIFFVVIVVIPMAAMGFLVFELIDGAANGKAMPERRGIATAAGRP
jgi:hypothetical protein